MTSIVSLALLVLAASCMLAVQVRADRRRKADRAARVKARTAWLADVAGRAVRRNEQVRDRLARTREYRPGPREVAR